MPKWVIFVGVQHATVAADPVPAWSELQNRSRFSDQVSTMYRSFRAKSLVDRERFSTDFFTESSVSSLISSDSDSSVDACWIADARTLPSIHNARNNRTSRVSEHFQYRCTCECPGIRSWSLFFSTFHGHISWIDSHPRSGDYRPQILQQLCCEEISNKS